jgi:hypothetical protein
MEIRVVLIELGRTIPFDALLGGTWRRARMKWLFVGGPGAALAL